MEGLDIRSLDSIAEVYSEVSEDLMDIIARNAWKYGITEEYMTKSFHLIHQDWYTGET